MLLTQKPFPRFAEMGRPAIEWTPAMVESIETEILSGRSIASICGTDVFPHNESTFWRHVAADKDFASIIARAVEGRSDRDIEQCREIAMGATAENWQLAQFQVRTLQWEAGKRKPKVYGDKLAHTGEDGGAIQLLCTIPRPPKE
jgi:hypothetical protein